MSYILEPEAWSKFQDLWIPGVITWEKNPTLWQETGRFFPCCVDSILSGSTRLGFQHKAKLDPESDPESTSNIPAPGVAWLWALGDGSPLSYALVKYSHLTNRQSNTFFQKTWSVSFHAVPRLQNYSSLKSSEAAKLVALCGAYVHLLWEDCLLRSLRRKNILFNSVGHIK